MNKKHIKIFKLETSSIKCVAGLSDFFGSTTVMMENCKSIGGVIDFPIIFTAIPVERTLEFIKMVKKTGTTINSISEGLLLNKTEIYKTLENLQY